MRLGEHLVSQKLITDAQLQQALANQAQKGGRLGTNLVELGFLVLDQVSVELGHLLSATPVLQKHLQTIPIHVLKLLPAPLAAKHLVVPIAAREQGGAWT